MRPALSKQRKLELLRLRALRRECRMWRKLYSHYPSAKAMRRTLASTDKLNALNPRKGTDQ